MSSNEIIIYTDGSCLNNPGRGGWAAVILSSNGRLELSGGFRLSTNNRMELNAAIQALRATPPDTTTAIRLHTDSQLLVNGIELGWARKWRANAWKRNKSDKAENPDLWGALLEEVEQRQVKFVWIKAHVGTKENERCDELAKAAAEIATEPDVVYERTKSADTLSPIVVSQQKKSSVTAKSGLGPKSSAPHEADSAHHPELFNEEADSDLPGVAAKGYRVRMRRGPSRLHVQHDRQGSIEIPLADLAELFELMKQCIQLSDNR